jgi:LemA protein
MSAIGLLIFLVALVIILVVFIIGLYNQLVSYRNRYKNAFSQIDVQLQRRYDLIPNLVETAKGYMKHERETLEAVTNARNLAQTATSRAAQNPGDPAAIQALANAESGLAGAMSRLLAVAEAYPDLKADQSMNRVMEELSSTENKVSFARQAFNDAVTLYNTARESFPAVLIAGTFGFGPAELLPEVSAEVKAAPRV